MSDGKGGTADLPADGFTTMATPMSTAGGANTTWPTSIQRAKTKTNALADHKQMAAAVPEASNQGSLACTL